MPHTTTRNIRFYKFFLGGPSANPNILDRSRLAEGLRDDINRKFCRFTDNFIVECEVDRTTPNQRLKFIKTIGQDLPYLANLSTLTRQSIPSGTGISDNCHFVLFDNNIIGYEVHGRGPSISKISRFLREVAEDLIGSGFSIHPLAKRDPRNSIRRVTKIAEYTLGTTADRLAQLADSRGDDTLFGSLQNLRGLTGGAHVRVTVTAEDSIKRKNLRGMADTSDIKAMLMNEADFADEIQVVGQDQQGRRLFVDLISQQLVFPRKMIQINSNRSVDSNSAYAAIEDAFAENQEAITRAELIIE